MLQRMLCLIAGATLAGCAQDKGGSVADCAPPAVDLAQVFEDEYIKPFREGRADDWAKVFADNAVGLHNRRPADVGREAINGFGRIVADTFEFAEYEPKIVETKVGCGWAMSRGEYSSLLVFRESGEPAPWGRQEGKFLIVWERQVDGSWKIVADMGNSNG